MRLNFFKPKEKRHTIAFYNIENLFDVFDDEITREEFNDEVEEEINIPSEIAAKFDLEYSSEDVWD